MVNVILVVENNHILGEVSRSEAHQKGLLHRVSVIYLYNDQGQILVQHRDDGRLDHSSAGHVDPGESYEEAARRELFEELGIKDIPLEKFAQALNEELRPNGDNIKHQYTIYKCKANPVKINKEEIQGVYWAKSTDVLKDMVQDPKNIKYTSGFKVSIQNYLKSI